MQFIEKYIKYNATLIFKQVQESNELIQNGDVLESRN